MPRGPGLAEPKPHYPYRSYLQEAIRLGYKPFTAGPYRTREDAQEAVRGFYRAGVGGSRYSLRNEGTDLSIRAEIRAHVPGRPWFVRVAVFTRAAALAYGRKHHRGERYGRYKIGR